MLKKNRNGFTLAELIAIIVILAIIALIAVPTITSILTEARIENAETNMAQYVKIVNDASALYDLEHNKMPETVEQLKLEGKNLENIELINLNFDELGKVKESKAIVNGLYCSYKKNEYSQCSIELYAYIKNIYNLNEIDKETIQNIYFVDEPRLGEYMDISLASNESILLYLEENGNSINDKSMYNAYIYSELMISAPEDSSNFFGELINLENLELNNIFDTSKVTNMNKMFYKAGLNSVNFELDLGNKFTFNETVTTTDFASECGVTKLVIPNTVTNIPSNTFKGMSKLSEIVFEHNENSHILLPNSGETTGAFYANSSIDTIVITSNDLIKNYDWLSDNRIVMFN